MDERERPDDLEGLLDLIREARGELLASFADLDEAAMTTPGAEGWSIKDHLAHVTAWEQIALVRHLEGRSFGEAAGMDEATSAATEHMTAEMGLNDWFHARDRELPLATVLEQFDASHRALLERLESTPWETLAAAEVGGHVAGNTFGHYREHTEHIRELRSPA